MESLSKLRRPLVAMAVALLSSVALTLTMAAAGKAAPAPAENRWSAPEEEEAERRCCFSNPARAGLCLESVAAESTCRDVLDYLNHPLSVGRPYCRGSEIRGGWQDVSTTESCRGAWADR